MSRLFRTARLRDVPLLVTAAFTVVLIRLCLWILPSRLLLRWIRGRVEGAPGDSSGGTAAAQRIGWAVRAVSRRVPQASCLTQALACQLMLARRGYASELKIGVARDAQNGFAAHAWVLCNGQVLVGGRDVGRFSELPDLAPRIRG